MKKEEFLAFSLPYGLKVYDCIGKSIELVDYSKGCPKCVCEAIGKTKNENKCVNVFQAAFDKQLKPILHKLSDLTKEIEHNGEKFVPIIELAKIEGLSNIEINIQCYGCFARKRTISFLYKNGCFIKGLICYEENEWVNDLNVNKQMQLLIKLIEWHFDIAVLIEKGEAIDVNTLESNPYR